MHKDFDIWNDLKKGINSSDATGIYFNEGEIWWCHIGINIGLEQNGKGKNFSRPVLIFKKFNRCICWVLPLSQKFRSGSFFFPLLSESNTIRMAILPQMKLIDAKRLIKKIDSISRQESRFVTEKIIAFIR